MSVFRAYAKLYTEIGFCIKKQICYSFSQVEPDFAGRQRQDEKGATHEE